MRNGIVLADPPQAADRGRRLGAERLARAPGPGRSGDLVGDAVRLLAAHPLLNPAAYVDASASADTLVVRAGPAHEDRAWVSLCGPSWTAALQAVVRGLDPHLDVEVSGVGEGEEWQARVLLRDDPAPEASEVAVRRFSTGSEFEFKPRRSLPITPV